MKNQFELFSLFLTFGIKIQTQFNLFAKTLQSDNAKECLTSVFPSFVSKHGILYHQTSCVNTLAQNGVGERKTSTCLRLRYNYFILDESSQTLFG